LSISLGKRYKNLAIYIAKCVAGVFLSYALTIRMGHIDYTWCIISVLLVLSPEGKDALDLALTRIAANLVGAGTGIGLLLLDLPNPHNIGIGAVVSLFLCDLFRLNSGAKSTLAAMIIICLHKEGAHVWDSSLDRVLAVGLGCILGLVITYVFHSLFRVKGFAEARLNGNHEREG
jgi:uncharacterized membrane protein YgaE (UPF0421/DUF939 family)